MLVDGMLSMDAGGRRSDMYGAGGGREQVRRRVERVTDESDEEASFVRMSSSDSDDVADAPEEPPTRAVHPPTDGIDRAADMMAAADAVIVACGAGMSLDSNLPDFRNEDAWHARYPMFQGRGLTYAHLASSALLDKNPRLAWGWYADCISLYAGSVPHRGYSILRAYSERLREGLFVYTSNVDGMFARAGFAEERIVQCHGCMQVLQCSKSAAHGTWTSDKSVQSVSLIMLF